MENKILKAATQTVFTTGIFIFLYGIFMFKRPNIKVSVFGAFNNRMLPCNIAWLFLTDCNICI